MSQPVCPRTRAAAVLLVVLAGLLVSGRLAHDAWLSRPEPADVPSRAAAPGPSPAFLLGIVDGLREAAVLDGSDPAMPFWRRLAATGASGVGVTGEPTLTSCCVRTLISGRNPDLATGFSNFDAKPVEGSVLQFLAERGARLAHAGDAAAWQMTRTWYRDADVLAFPDRGPADQGETDERSFPFALEKALDGVDVLTVHFVRPDHVAHKYGATGKEYRDACRQVDERLREIVAAYHGRHPDGTVLLSADHGVTARGTHGGGEPEARRAPFVLAGPGVARISGVEIPQSSLAPTVAALLGLPPPPLAETPPALELTTFAAGRRDAAMNAWLSARIEVARRVGAKDLADAIDKRRAMVWKERAGERIPGFAALAAELEAGAFAARLPGAIALALFLAGLWLAVVARAADPPRGERHPLAALAGAFAVAAAVLVPPPAAAVILACACVALVSTTTRSPAGTRLLALAGFAALPVLGGAGLVLQTAYDAVQDAGPVGARTGLVAAAMFAAAAFVGTRRSVLESLRAEAERRPGLLAAVSGLLLGFSLSLRLFIDPFVHTPILFAIAGGAAVLALALSKGARERAPRARWVVVGICGVLFAGSRIAEGIWKDAWVFSPALATFPWSLVAGVLAAWLLADAVRSGGERSAVPAGRIPVLAAGFALLSSAVYRTALTGDVVAWGATLGLGLAALGLSLALGTERERLSARLLAALALASLLHERSDLQAALFAALVVAARLASDFAAPRARLGVAGLAVALLAVRVASFHALGFVESISAIDTGAGVVPGTASMPVANAVLAPGMSIENRLNLALLFLKFGLTWIVLLAAAARAFSRDAFPDGLRLLAVDVSIALASRGAAIVAAAWVWWRSSWWAATARTVFLFGVCDALLLLAALALVGGFGARRTEMPVVAATT